MYSSQSCHNFSSTKLILSDEVVPYLGAYQRVMQMIKNELHGKCNETGTLC